MNLQRTTIFSKIIKIEIFFYFSTIYFLMNLKKQISANNYLLQISILLMSTKLISIKFIIVNKPL